MIGLLWSDNCCQEFSKSPNLVTLLLSSSANPHNSFLLTRSVTRLGEILLVFGKKLTVYFLYSKMLSQLWQICDIIGLFSLLQMAKYWKIFNLITLQWVTRSLTIVVVHSHWFAFDGPLELTLKGLDTSVGRRCLTFDRFGKLKRCEQCKPLPIMAYT